MKFSTAYYFLLLYVTIICKPLIPYISDAASHFFDDAIHVATVHTIYGDNHVEIELAATGSADENNKNQSTLKVQEPVSVHISVEPILLYNFSIQKVSTFQKMPHLRKLFDKLYFIPFYRFFKINWIIAIWHSIMCHSGQLSIYPNLRFAPLVM